MRRRAQSRALLLRLVRRKAWSRSGRVLVVSHEASRTGAPRVAVDLLTVLAPSYRTVVVQRWGGPLESELAAAAGRSIREPLSRVRAFLRSRRRTRRLARFVEQAAALGVLMVLRPRLVWLNTVLSACYVGPARWLGVPVILHVHELEPLASTVLDRYGLRDRLGVQGVRVVACSSAVARHVTELCRLGPGQVTVVESVPRPGRITALADAGSTVGPDLGRTVVCCGTADRRKGIDVWLQVAATVLSDPANDDVRFVWVGLSPEGGDGAMALGLGDRVWFTGELANPYPVLAAATVFTLFAREDPFPLAVLEAMILGRPVVVSAAGGMPDQVGDSGIVVPVEDVGAAAGAVAGLLADPEARARLGRAGVERARTEFGIDRFAAAVTALVGVADVPSGSPS